MARKAPPKLPKAPPQRGTERAREVSRQNLTPKGRAGKPADAQKG